jgi:hypothetical protein
VQVVLDSARTDEQLRADLLVRAPVAGQAGDLRLLRGEDVPVLLRAPGNLLAGSRELLARALGKGPRADSGERVMRVSELLARIDAPVLAAQPLPVQELGAGEVDDATAAPEPLDRLAVEGLRGGSITQQRA